MSTPYPCVTQGSIYTNPYRVPATVLPGANPTCGDPYTMYGYWRRRFCSDYNYLTCYYYPYTDSRFYANGYLNVKNSNCETCGEP
jgi:hypothetical protein